MNYLFIIQGEGRGHLSQAIAYSEKISNAGDKVVAVYFGTSPNRQVPTYVTEFFGDKIKIFRSPNFLRTPDKKGILPILSVIYNFLISPVFFSSIIRLRREIRNEKIDKVINFYDIIGGLANFLSFSNKQTIVVSHHFFLGGKYFSFPKGYPLQRIFLMWHNHICALKANEIRALSFTKNESYGRIMIKPPFLRKDVINQQAKNGDFILVYLLNEGLIGEITNIAGKFPDISIRIYTSNRVDLKDVLPNMEIRKPDHQSFVSDLAECRSFITTAGFESQCEAAFLGKTVYVIPSKRHFEQQCNALDGKRSGISFSIDEFEPNKEIQKENLDRFRKWCSSALLS